MKQLIVDYLPFEVRPEQINESMKDNGGKLIVKGVLQRAEAKNQNGRINKAISIETQRNVIENRCN